MMARVEKQENRCWNWQPGVTPAGYAVITMTDGDSVRHTTAHRYAYELWVGVIPDGHEIDHICFNRSCVNPDHLQPLTRRENIKRSQEAGRLVSGNSLKTHCAQGHAYDEGNTYRWVSPEGYTRRYCRKCQKARGH
jgi:hypothetical protein